LLATLPKNLPLKVKFKPQAFRLLDLLVSVNIGSLAGDADHATPSLPSNLNDFTVFDQHRHGVLPAFERLHPRASGGVKLDVVFHELAPLPFEPLPHLAAKRAARSSVKLKVRHA
jgi:hypothetical protein